VPAFAGIGAGNPDALASAADRGRSAGPDPALAVSYSSIFSDVSLKYLVEGLRCEIEVHLAAASKRVSSQGLQAELSLHDDAVVDG
jgi:hypothetical protein